MDTNVLSICAVHCATAIGSPPAATLSPLSLTPANPHLPPFSIPTQPALPLSCTRHLLRPQNPTYHTFSMPTPPQLQPQHLRQLQTPAHPTPRISPSRNGMRLSGLFRI
ncbi:hypothetical protein BDQ12DRAFT_690741 [Crucibulum laeve]|uniref:Uncharacterized protein n=1 Tax=Crucibulum laeve TaxID=68775 RepID=A0A5C3LKY7_9AGAR|nr:hypothetical protein BDQ12DRAFT_690741 [Crucibulum laeve]